MSTPTKALIYCRVSTTKQVKEGHGLDSQETRCREFAEQKGLTVEAVFPDDASGGGDFMKRPGMAALLAYLKNHPDEPHTVIFDDLKRFARDTMFHWQLRHQLAEYGAKVECLNFKFEDTVEGQFVETIFAAQAQLEREQNRRQTIQKMQARFKKGYWMSNPPKGYCYATVLGHGKLLVKDEPLASIVTEALEGFASGRFASQAEVKRFLETQPAFPKSKDGTVHFQRVINLLNCNIYAGYISSKKNDLHNIKGQHEPLISYDTFLKIQARLNNQAKAPTRQDLNLDFPLRGFVNCSCCNHPMTATNSKGRNKYYSYYLCLQKGCDNYGKSIAKEKMESEFNSLLRSLKPSEALFTTIEAMYRDYWDISAQEHQDENKATLIEVQKTDKQVSALLDRIMVTENSAVVSAYENRITELQAQKLRLETKVKKCGTSLPDFETSFRTAFDFLSNPYKIWASEHIEDKRAVLKLAFTDNLIYDRNEGFRTASIAEPFRLCKELTMGKSSMVPGPDLKHIIISLFFNSFIRR
jgi:DNA invertase Pin-like site-specific DNA recombinase